MPEGEAPHPQPGNPCGVCMEVNDDNGNPLRGHDLGRGGTEQLHWFCSPCIANLWSCPLCRRPHRLCTAPPPRETQDKDLRLQTLRTLIRQNVWNDGAGEDGPDAEWLDVLTDEDPATPPPPAPAWRAPTWALPDPEADPTVYIPDHEDNKDAPRGSLPPIGNLPGSWGYASPSNHNNYRNIVVTLTNRLSIAFGWLRGRGMGDGHRPRRPWRRLGGFLPPRRSHDPGGDREAYGGLPHVEGHTPSTEPRIADTAQPAAARPATTTMHIRQCSGGQDDGQRYPARQVILLPPKNHRNHHHPPAPIPRHDSD